MNRLKSTLRLTATATLITCAGSGPARAAKDIDWIVAPYVWLPTITVDFETPRDGDGSGGAGEDTFPDILDELDGAFLGYVEAQGDRWGGSMNLLYLGLESDEPFEIALTSSDLDTTIVDAAVVYSFDRERFQGFELYGGLRYVDIGYEAGIDFTTPALASRTVDIRDSYADFLLGARWRDDFGKRWGYALEADASTGSTEIHVDGAELSDARWFTREEMKEQAESGELVLPGGISISRSLVEAWYGAPLPGSW